MKGSQFIKAETGRDPSSTHYLKARRLGIRTHQEAVVYMTEKIGRMYGGTEFDGEYTLTK